MCNLWIQRCKETPIQQQPTNYHTYESLEEREYLQPNPNSQRKHGQRVGACVVVIWTVMLWGIKISGFTYKGIAEKTKGATTVHGVEPPKCNWNLCDVMMGWSVIWYNWVFHLSMLLSLEYSLRERSDGHGCQHSELLAVSCTTYLQVSIAVQGKTTFRHVMCLA